MAFLLDRPPYLGGLPRFQHPNDITDFPKPPGYLCGHGQGVVLSVFRSLLPRPRLYLACPCSIAVPSPY
jgi:hypothetical protein